MTVFYYDETYEGLLSAIFKAYEDKIFPDVLLRQGEIPPLLTTHTVDILTTVQKAARGEKLLKKEMDVKERNMLRAVWLSEETKSDFLVFQYIKKAIDSKFTGKMNFGDPVIIEIHQLAKKVYKEVHSWQQFVRFQKSKDGVYFAPVYPVFNSLPLAIPFFKDRFASQQWIIYDLKRNYGFYYDLQEVKEIILEGDGEHLITGKLDKDLLHPEELFFQESWKKYFKAMTIKERINIKQQKQYMPKRYWKYLTEKQ